MIVVLVGMVWCSCVVNVKDFSGDALADGECVDVKKWFVSNAESWWSCCWNAGANDVSNGE